MSRRMISKQQVLAAELLVVPEGFATARSPSEETHMVLLEPHETPIPATPSWLARSANGSIDRHRPDGPPSSRSAFD